MTDTYISPFSEGRRSSWIRLRTLILLRWAAIFGQISAIFIAIGYFNLQIELLLCLIAIGVSIAANIGAMFVFPGNKRLSETQNMLMILFDVLQLGFLLYLTGGLQNPFSILLLAPVAVSASVLTLRSTIVLGGSAIVIATVLSLYHIPLTTIDGLLLGIPDIFIFGNWIAIVIALIFLSVYSRWITSEMNAMGDALLATQMALSREQKLTDLGGVVAAAAHELGTPLATIKLTSAELMEELQGQPELYEDAELIKKQADRCRDILRSMGRVGK
ncbi:MAG: histidine kinase dimerization/phospho-acceptor domain-containing protein, partial [Paracoccaceae bacterium]